MNWDVRHVGFVPDADMEGASIGSIKWGLGLGAVVSSLESVVEFRKVDDHVWLPLRDEMTATGRMLLVKRFRKRISRTYGNYRRFQVEAQEQAH